MRNGKISIEKSATAVLFSVLLYAVSATAIEIDGSGDKTNLVALYLFKNYNTSTGVVPDTSGVGSPLDLQVDLPANVEVVNEVDPNFGSVRGLKLRVAAVLRSINRASKVLSCGTSGSKGLSVDMYIRNLSEEPVGWTQPTRIVTLSKLSVNGAISVHTNRFYVGQQYISNGVINVSLAGGGNAYMSPDTDGMLMFGTQQPIQRVTYTLNDRNVGRLWMSNGAGTPQKYVERPGAQIPKNWENDPSGDYRLAFGNEPFYSLFPRIMPDPMDPKKTISHTEQKSWLGTLYAVAIFCRGIEPQEILGSRAGNTPLPAIPLPKDLSSFVITPELKRAHLIYKRITGLNTPIYNPVVIDMADRLKAASSTDDEVAAARLATADNFFYNITVRDMAARMSTRDQTVNTPLNDMVATIIGVARDDIPATQLLTGNFYYYGRPDLTNAPMDLAKDFLTSNNHYEVLEEGRYDLAGVLTIANGQKLYNGATGSIVPNPDPAGVLTSRAFLAAHAVAGTNRRAVEFTMKEFGCLDINNWSDTTTTDGFVGRDVDRAPGGEHDKYKATCRACHAPMDGFRGAFAKWDFSANYVKYADIIPASNDVDDNDQMGLMFQDPPGISGKYARNNTTFSDGYPTQSTYWQNNANIGLNSQQFGWPAVPSGQATHKGYGVKSFASLVSQSKAFPRCMAIRAFKALCKRTPGQGFTNAADAKVEVDLMDQIGDEFATKYGYRIRDLFARIAVTPQCLGN